MESSTCDVCGSPISAEQVVFGSEKHDLRLWFETGVFETPKPSLWRRGAATLIDLGVIVLITSFVGGSLIFIIAAKGFGLLCMLIVAAYYILPYSSSGQTIGKKWLHIRVVTVDGSPLNWMHGILRLLGYVSSAMPLMLGYLWAIWDRDGQAWHDKLAGTIVIPEDYKFVPLVDGGMARAQTRKWVAITVAVVASTALIIARLTT